MFSDQILSNRAPTGKRGAMYQGDVVPKRHRIGQLQQFGPEQMQLFKQLFSHVSPDSYLGQMAEGDESFFNEMEAPALRQFNALQGNIASRFSAMGGLGARRSSGFQNETSAAASNFAQDLASRRQAMQRQAIIDLLGLGESLLAQRPQERFLSQKAPKQGSQWGQIAGKLAGAIPGAVAGYYTGGSQGAAQGVSGAASTLPYYMGGF